KLGEHNADFFAGDRRKLPRKAVAGVAVLHQTYLDRKAIGPGSLKDLHGNIDRDVRDRLEDALIDLHGKYASFLVAKGQQSYYIGEDNRGVCCAFCTDWIPRRQTLRRAKASLAVSQKGPSTRPGPDALVKDAKLPANLDPARMKRKVDRRIGPA